MSDLDDQELLDEIRALENALEYQIGTARSSPERLTKNTFVNYKERCQEFPEKFSTFQDKFADNIDGLDEENSCSAFRCNELIIEALLVVKKEVISLLEECEQKLRDIDIRLEQQTGSNTKTILSTVGIPYFKDRDHFAAPRNADTKLKAARGELQIVHLHKVSRWTLKDRNTLAKAIKLEVISPLLEPTNDKITEVEEKGSNAKKDTKCLPSDFKEMVGPLGEKEFDWLKIAASDFDQKHTATECRVMWNVFLHPEINKCSWKKLEDATLKSIVKKYKYQNWDEISNTLNTGRTGYQCFIRYNTQRKMGKIKCRTWQPKEDERLLYIINKFKIGDYVPWAIVARYMRNRTKQQIYFRWIYSLAPHLKKGRFTKEEDMILIDAIKQYGENFCKISAMLMPHRSSIQIHDHYRTLNLRKKGRGNIWTITDDLNIIEHFNSIGPNWAEIAKHFVDKTRTQVRHRYRALRKYFKRGVSILQIPRAYNVDYHKEEVAITKLMPQHNQKDSLSTDIEWQLTDHFHVISHSSKFNQREPYTHDELMETVQKLYKMLNVLHANLNIPINYNKHNLTKRDKQLLDAIKSYLEVQNNPHMKSDIIETFRTRMFGARSKLENLPHFTPPPPSLSHMRKTSKRKSKNNNCIDYALDLRQKFILDIQWEFELLESVSRLIGGEEQEKQFQKICQLVQFSDQTLTKSKVQQQIYVLRPNILSNNTNIGKCVHNIKSQTSNTSISLTSVADRNILYEEKDTYCSERIRDPGSSNTSMEELSNIVLSSYCSYKSFIPKMPTIVEPSYTTLFSFKQLLSLKHLFDANIPHSSAINIEQTNSVAFQNAYQLLRARLLQLFKYPIGLSKISVPEIYETDIFLHDSPEKRKSQWDILTRNKKRKLTAE